MAGQNGADRHLREDRRRPGRRVETTAKGALQSHVSDPANPRCNAWCRCKGEPAKRTPPHQPLPEKGLIQARLPFVPACMLLERLGNLAFGWNLACIRRIQCSAFVTPPPPHPHLRVYGGFASSPPKKRKPGYCTLPFLVG